MKKITSTLLALLAITFAGSVAFARPETKPTCPIMKDSIDKINPKLSSTYKGKTFYFCCEGCKPSFDKMSDADKAGLMKYGVASKKATSKKASPASTKSGKKPA